MSAERNRILTQLSLVRYRRGDPTALDELTRLWSDTLFYYVMRLIGNEEDAWDVLQETWLSLIRGIGRLRRPGNVVAWLHKTARNKAMDRLREKYRLPTTPLDCEEFIEADNGVEEFEHAEIVHSALARLSLSHREVLTLFFLQDLNLEEISQVLATSTGTVKSRLHYAKRALRAILEQEGFS